MKRWSILVMAVALVAIGARAEAQSLDPAARQALRAEVDAFFDQYYAWYSAGAADEIAGQAYNVPYVRGDGSALGTRDEVRQWVADAWARLDAQGYAGSDMPDRNICILGAGSAIVSGRGVRYHRGRRPVGRVRLDVYGRHDRRRLAHPLHLRTRSRARRAVSVAGAESSRRGPALHLPPHIRGMAGGDQRKRTTRGFVRTAGAVVSYRQSEFVLSKGVAGARQQCP